MKVAEHVVDVDGHVLEPEKPWMNTWRPRIANRAIWLELNEDGLEVVMVDNQPFDRISPGGIASSEAWARKAPCRAPTAGTWMPCRSACAIR